MKIIALLISLTLALANTANAAVSGEIILAKGVVTATDANQASRSLSKGTKIEEGDIIRTGKKSFAVIRMIDNSKLSLKPDSTIAIGTFDITEGQEEGCLNLLKGGLRVVTGLIGDRKPEAFILDSAIASIGIRGTDFIARICAGDECAVDEQNYADEQYQQAGDATLPESINENLPQGLYGSCETGKIVLSQCAGQAKDFKVGQCRTRQERDCNDVFLDAGQAGYVSYGVESFGDLSGRLPFFPKFLKNDPHFRISTLDDETLELIDFFKDEFSTEKQCQIDG